MIYIGSCKRWICLSVVQYFIYRHFWNQGSNPHPSDYWTTCSTLTLLRHNHHFIVLSSKPTALSQWICHIFTIRTVRLLYSKGIYKDLCSITINAQNKWVWQSSLHEGQFDQRPTGGPKDSEAQISRVSLTALFVYLFRQSQQRYQMFDASKYVLGPCL